MQQRTGGLRKGGAQRAAAAGLLLGLLATSTASASADSRPAQVDALFAAWNRTDSPGAVVEVIQDGRPILERGYGMADIEQGSPNRPETVFSLASMSKQFTAACVALLVEDGRLRLDQDVRTIIPELPRYAKPVTVEQLVHHTSGLRDYLVLWAMSGRSLTDSMPEDQILDLIARQKAPNFEPGSEYLYSNTDYQLLALIVQRVSGQSFAAFAQKTIFDPLGMRHTHFHDDVTRLVPLVAAPYERRPDGGFALVRTQVALVGAGKAYSTAEDLALWDANFYANRLGKGGPALIDLMLAPGRRTDGRKVDYAFGLDVDVYRGLPAVHHSGESVGISTMIVRFPAQRTSVVVLGNLGQLHASAVAYRVADIYLADRFTAPPALAPSPPAAPAPSASPAALGAASPAWIGRYHSDELDADYLIERKGDGLAVRGGAHLQAGLIPLDRDRFSLALAEGQHASGRFTRDGSGQIDGFELNAGRVTGVRFRRAGPAPA